MNYAPARPLFDHQIEAVSRMAGKNSYALLMEFGTGKSACIVTDAGRLYSEGKIDGVLVCAPKGVYRDWSLEDPAKSHWCLNLDPKILKSAQIVRWQGAKTKSEIQELETLNSKTLFPGFRVFVMDTEALSSGTRAWEACVKFVLAHRTMMVVDESTMVKNRKANRTKRVTLLAGRCDYRRILTGFPAPKSSMDLFSQFGVLNWQILGFKSFYAYRERYAVLEEIFTGSRWIKKEVGYQNTDEIWHKISPHSYRVRSDDCLNLPPIQYVQRLVGMPSKTRTQYNLLRAQATVELEKNKHVTATIVLTMIMRLHQLACGHAGTEDGELVPVETHKLDELLELIDEIGPTEKVVIWTHWRFCIYSIFAKLTDKEHFGPGSTVTYFGDTPDAERAKNLHRFAHDPNCRFFIGSQMAGGRGINDLVVARHAVFYSNPFDLELRLNAEARTRRHGSEHHSSVIYHDLTTEDTVEEKIVNSLRSKLDIASLVVGDKWREWVV